MEPAEIREMVKAAFIEVLEERARIDADTHAAHHAVISEWVECSKRRREIVEKIVTQVLGWSVMAGVGWLGYAILNALREGTHR